MSEHCPAIEELEALLALPDADPRRRHVDDCARCRSLAGMLAEFASGSAAPAESGFASADVALRDTIAALTGVREDERVSARDSARDGAGAPVAAVPEEPPQPRFRPARPEPRAPWWSLGALRPAFAFAALLVVATAGVALWRANAPAPVMRDATGGAFTASATPPAGGKLHVEWTSVAGADGYRVVFLDASLREIARLERVAASPALLDAAALPPGLEHGAEVAWEVQALSGADVIRSTAVRTLRVP